MSKFYETTDGIEELRAKLNIMGEYALHLDEALYAMTARKDGYRRVARKYREMWLVHFSGALMDQMGIEDPNDPDLGER